MTWDVEPEWGNMLRASGSVRNETKDTGDVEAEPRLVRPHHPVAAI
jgi:hypothetical protein